jgi:hypothetical protein
MDASLSQNHHPSLKKTHPTPRKTFQMFTQMHVYHKISILLPKYSSPYTQVYNSDESTSDFCTNPSTRKYPNPFHKFSLLVPNKPLMKDMQKNYSYQFIQLNHKQMIPGQILQKPKQKILAHIAQRR